jgi:hypothetical protein
MGDVTALYNAGLVYVRASYSISISRSCIHTVHRHLFRNNTNIYDATQHIPLRIHLYRRDPCFPLRSALIRSRSGSSKIYYCESREFESA